jgi:hypothetical protein
MVCGEKSEVWGATTAFFLTHLPLTPNLGALLGDELTEITQ